MAIKFAVATRNARLDAVETDVGTAAILKIFTATQPSSATAADAGTLIVKMTLTSNWMNDAGSGSKTKNGTWSGTATASGTAQHFRIYTSATGPKISGTVSASGGGGDMEIDAVGANINNSQTVTVSTFTLTDGNS